MIQNKTDICGLILIKPDIYDYEWHIYSLKLDSAGNGTVPSSTSLSDHYPACNKMFRMAGESILSLSQPVYCLSHVGLC